MSKFYKNKRSIEFKVGLFFIIGIAVLFFSIFYLKDMLDSGDKQEIMVLFESTAGLDPGDKVKLNGIDVGKIKSIELSEEGVIVHLLVNEFNFKIPKDTHFIAAESSLMGGHHLIMSLGESDEAMDYSEYQKGDPGSSVMGMVRNAKYMLDDLALVVKRASLNLDIIDSTKVIINEAKEGISDFQNILSDNKGDLVNIINNLEESTTEMKNIMINNREKIDSTLTLAPTVMSTLDESMIELKSLLTKMNSVADTLQSSDSTVNNLISNRDLYDKLLKTVEKADSLMEDVKQNPRKYINLEIF